MQFREIAESMLPIQFGDCEVKQDVDVRSVGIGKVDVFDERRLFEDIFGFIDFA